MRKITCLILAIVFLLSISACSGVSDDPGFTETDNYILKIVDGCGCYSYQIKKLPIDMKMGNSGQYSMVLENISVVKNEGYRSYDLYVIVRFSHNMTEETISGILLNELKTTVYFYDLKNTESFAYEYNDNADLIGCIYEKEYFWVVHGIKGAVRDYSDGSMYLTIEDCPSEFYAPDYTNWSYIESTENLNVKNSFAELSEKEKSIIEQIIGK